MNTKLILILPCYNEEPILYSTYEKLNTLLNELIDRDVISEESRICFVDDGSADKTWEIIENINKKSDNSIGIKLSRNFGHQYALLAGLTSQCGKFDAFITIDADLQDDISVIEKMIVEYQNGNSIVYGVRNDRTTDTFFKRQTANMFYKLMVSLGVKTIPNHADFRLMDNRAVTEMLNFGESNLFLRGIVPLVGFNHSKVYYKRNEREAGETKYPLKKMIRFAWDGISSFSTKPMRIILFLGVYTFLFSIAVSTWSFITFLQDKTIPGWVSTVLPISIIGGVQVISIGIIGEYIGKIYNEVKKRPRFIIDKTLVSQKNN